MKMTKRIVALLVALFVLLSAMPVLADGETSPAGTKITIINENTNVTIVGRNAQVYKLFSANSNSDGSAVTFFFDSSCVSVTYGGKSGDELIPVLGEMDTDPDAIRAFADTVQSSAGTATKESAEAGSETLVIDGLDEGYYLVILVAKNPNGAKGKDDITGRAMLVSAYGTAGGTVNLKADAPQMTKEIQHNELAGEDGTQGWGTVGDNQIGDTVHYRTVTTVPDTTGYTKYVYTIHDTMDAGLSFVEGSVGVYTDEAKTDTTRISSDYVHVDNCGNSDHTFCITVDVLEAGLSDCTLWTYYDAILNEDALIYTDGPNDNTAYLQYSNDVYDTTGTKTGETPKVTVHDWTFTFGIQKVDASANQIEDDTALFVLSKKWDLTVTYDGSALSSTADLIGFVSDGNYTVSATPGTYLIEAGSAILRGLDDHETYYLYEVKEPAGYKKLDAPVPFTISCKYKDDGAACAEKNPGVICNSANVTNIDMVGCELCAGIVNQSGSVLPSTGGMGTTLFYVVGGAIVVLAVALLVLRRRASK